jgi:hypothetical protein
MRHCAGVAAIEDPEDGYTLAGEMLEEISSLLYLPPASPELRAALYRVMTRIEGVELLGERSDPLGRRGITFARAGGYGKETSTRVLLILDPQTSQVLAQETELVRPAADWVDADSPVVLPRSHTSRWGGSTNSACDLRAAQRGRSGYGQSPPVRS